jgi:hypothetical protein
MQDELNVSLDLTQVHDEQDLEGNAVLPPGRYHVAIREVFRRSDPSAHLLVKYEVLAGTNAAAVGAVSAEKLFLSDKAAKRVAILGHRLGLIDDKAFGRRIDFDSSALLGRDLVVEIINEPYEGKDGEKRVASKWNFAGFWATTDPRVKDVPRGAVTARPATPTRPAAPPGRQATLPNGTDAYSDL